MENLNAEREQITNINNELYDYVKKIVAAVKYNGDGDHEDVPSVLRKFAKGYEQRIKELTEENKAWQKSLITQKENEDKGYYELACEVENLRAENERFREENNIYANNAERIAENYHRQGSADTVQKYREKLYRELASLGAKDKFSKKFFLTKADQIAKEMLEGL